MKGHEEEKRTLPALDIKTGHNHSPHVVILGAGASRACCPKGDRNGHKLPLMNDFVDTLNLNRTIEEAGENPRENFEAVYSRLYRANATAALEQIRKRTYSYFSQLELPDKLTIYDYLISG